MTILRSRRSNTGDLIPELGHLLLYEIWMKILRPVKSLVCHLFAKRNIREYMLQGRRHVLHAGRVKIAGGVSRHFWHGRDPRCQNRRSRCHGLQHGNSKALIQRRKKERTRLLIDAAQLLFVDEREKGYE